MTCSQFGDLSTMHYYCALGFSNHFFCPLCLDALPILSNLSRNYKDEVDDEAENVSAKPVGGDKCFANATVVVDENFKLKPMKKSYSNENNNKSCSNEAKMTKINNGTHSTCLTHASLIPINSNINKKIKFNQDVPSSFATSIDWL